MSRRSHPEQFELFPASKDGAERLPSPSFKPEESTPTIAEEPYHPTTAEEQERLEMEHGPGATYHPPKSQKEREAEKRYIRDLIERTKRMLGIPPSESQSEMLGHDDHLKPPTVRQ